MINQLPAERPLEIGARPGGISKRRLVQQLLASSRNESVRERARAWRSTESPATSRGNTPPRLRLSLPLKVQDPQCPWARRSRWDSCFARRSWADWVPGSRKSIAWLTSAPKPSCKFPGTIASCSASGTKAANGPIHLAIRRALRAELPSRSHAVVTASSTAEALYPRPLLLWR